MPGIAEILSQRKYVTSKTIQKPSQLNLFSDEPRRISEKAERSLRVFAEAERFGKYVGIETKAVLALFKRYGKQRVLSQSSFLRDAPERAQNGKKTNKVGLLVWKLKQSQKA